MKKNIIALDSPDIPFNTGNIGRTCVATNTELHLIRPLGFSISDKYVKKAGMDYWPHVDLHVWDSLDEFMQFAEEKAKNEGFKIIYLSTKSDKNFTQLDVGSGPCIMLFGSESTGLDEDFMREHPERCYRIPMYADTRCLNLSNSAAITVYEVLRQEGYPNLH